MNNKKLRVLLVIDQCNPELPSVPLVAYQLFNGISEVADVTLVTHERNKQAIEKVKDNEEIIYIPESKLTKKYYLLTSRITEGEKGTNWPLNHLFYYLIYEEFNYKVYQRFKTEVLEGDYDIVHAMTPILPRYPVGIIKACKSTPFILGPVNGGVPFPKGFEQVARKEFAYLNFLRRFSLFIPGYKETYRKADKILAGSAFTLNMLTKIFNFADNKIELFYENGVSEEFFKNSVLTKNNRKINLLFVGRLVPYKGADIVLAAVSELNKSTEERIGLTIVGDGCEKDNLKRQTQELGLSGLVNFVGWVDQKEIVKFYKEADIFCFPSIREFGGAVVLEAMACGLPCIVTDNGGVAEYVTEETGFKLKPISKENLIWELAHKIQVLIKDEELRRSMSVKAVERVKAFTWKQKANKMIKIYEDLVKKKTRCR